jgi:hypothetical protein
LFLNENVSDSYVAKKKKVKLKRYHIALGMVVLLVILVVLLVGVIKYGPFASQEDVGPSVYQIDKDRQIVYYPYSLLQSDFLTMGGIVLAKEFTDTSLIVNDTFEHGSEIYFILTNATGFSVQANGYSWYDVDVSIEKEDGTLVFSEKSILGDAGKLFLKSPVITPYGMITIPIEAQPGNYNLNVNLYDVYSNESVLRTIGFRVLEPKIEEVDMVLEQEVEELEMPEPVFEA